MDITPRDNHDNERPQTGQGGDAAGGSRHPNSEPWSAWREYQRLVCELVHQMPDVTKEDNLARQAYHNRAMKEYITLKPLAQKGLWSQVRDALQSLRYQVVHAD